MSFPYLYKKESISACSFDRFAAALRKQTMNRFIRSLPASTYMMCMATLFVVSILCAVVAAQALPSIPVKLDVRPANSSVQVGDPVQLQIGLRNANNEVAKAPKDLTIGVQYHLAADKV